MKSGRLVLGALSALTVSLVAISVVYTKSYSSEDKESSERDKKISLQELWKTH